jgi:hypothetical protein
MIVILRLINLATSPCNETVGTLSAGKLVRDLDHLGILSRSMLANVGEIGATGSGYMAGLTTHKHHPAWWRNYTGY